MARMSGFYGVEPELTVECGLAAAVALLDAVGFVPLVGDGIKGARSTNKLNELRRSIDTLNSGVAHGLRYTRQAALGHWDNIVRNNQAAYRRALDQCNGARRCLDAAALHKGPHYDNTPTSNTGSWNPPEGRGDGVFTPQ
jgi:hypothetical protein